MLAKPDDVAGGLEDPPSGQAIPSSFLTYEVAGPDGEEPFDSTVFIKEPGCRSGIVADGFLLQPFSCRAPRASINRMKVLDCPGDIFENPVLLTTRSPTKPPSFLRFARSHLIPPLRYLQTNVFNSVTRLNIGVTALSLSKAVPESSLLRRAFPEKSQERRNLRDE